MLKQSRRNFLVSMSLKTVGLVLVATGLQAKTINGSDMMIDYPTSKTNHTSDNKPAILIAYASYYGSTAEIADYIKKKHFTHNAYIDVRHVNDIESITPYKSIIIGSPVHFGKWMNEISLFLKNHSDELKTIPVACFLTCLAATKKDIKSQAEVKSFCDVSFSEFTMLKPYSTEVFPGKLDYKKCTFYAKIVMKLIMGIKGVKEGDYRDWTHISSWISGLEISLKEMNIIPPDKNPQ